MYITCARASEISTVRASLMRERVKSAGGYPSGREDRVATAKKVFLTKKERREERYKKR